MPAPRTRQQGKTLARKAYAVYEESAPDATARVITAAFADTSCPKSRADGALRLLSKWIHEDYGIPAVAEFSHAIRRAQLEA